MTQPNDIQGQLSRLANRDSARAASLALVALVLDLYFYSGFYMSDDVSYLTGIQRIANLEPIDPKNLAHARLGVTLPAAAVYACTGSTALTILSFCAYHPLTTLLAYFIASMVFGPSVALLGAGLVALCPIYYFFGGAILPDNALSFWVAAVLALVLWGVRQRAQVEAPPERWLWGSAGLVTGVAYAAKEPGIIMAVPAALAIVGDPRRRGWLEAVTRLGSYGAGLLMFFAFEATVLRAFSGQWSFRMLSGVASPTSVAAFVERVSQQGSTPWARLSFWYDRAAPFFGVGLGLWLIALTNALAAWIFRGDKRRDTAILIMFWVWPFLYLTFGTTNFSRYLPPPIQHARYYSVCALPALIVTAAGLIELSRRVASALPAERPRTRRALLAAPALFGAAWACLMFLRVEWRAGTAYRAHLTKTALLAYEDARRGHPELPVVLSDFLSRRLAPLLPKQAGSGANAARLVSLPEAAAALPKRPFLLLNASDAYGDGLELVLRQLDPSRTLEAERAGRGSYLAPYGRRAELRAAAYPLLSSFAEPPRLEAETKNVIELWLLSDAAP